MREDGAVVCGALYELAAALVMRCELDELEVWQVTDDGIITTRKLGQLV